MVLPLRLLPSLFSRHVMLMEVLANVNMHCRESDDKGLDLLFLYLSYSPSISPFTYPISFILFLLIPPFSGLNDSRESFVLFPFSYLTSDRDRSSTEDAPTWAGSWSSLVHTTFERNIAFNTNKVPY